MEGPDIQKVLTAAESENIAVASAAVVYTKAMSIRYGEYFAVRYKASSVSSTPDVKIEIEQSSVLPTTEGSQDANWVEPESMSDINASVADEVWHAESISPIALPYIRFKLTGAGGNPADTIVNMELGITSSKG